MSDSKRQASEFVVQRSLFEELEGFEPPLVRSTGADAALVGETTTHSRGFEPPATNSFRLISPDEIYEGANQEVLRNLREDRRIERKPAGFHARALGDYLCMWANTPPSGGLIVIGQENDGAFTGCSSLSQGRINELEKAGETFCPDARVRSKHVPIERTLDGGEDFVLLFRVEYREDKLVETTKGDSYHRLGDSKIAISPDLKREIQHDRGQIGFELEPSRLTYPEDFDLGLVRAFCASVVRHAGLSAGQTPEELLAHRRLGRLRDGRFIPNAACELLFATDPGYHFPGAKIRFLRFEGEEEGTGNRFTPSKDEWIEGPIPKIIPAAAKVIQSQLRDFRRLGPDNRFYTAPEYPTTAWHEAIVNAVCHRSYGLRSMHVSVKMFDDRLVIESPGGFPPLVTPENIYFVSHPRNRILMEAMYYFDFVWLNNEGTRRMRDSMKEMSLPLPEFKQLEAVHAGVRVTLRNNIKQRKEWIVSDLSALIGETILRELNQEEIRALNFVAENGGRINVSQTLRLLGKSWKSAKKLLVRLAKKGLLVQVKRPGLDRDPEAHFALRARMR